LSAVSTSRHRDHDASSFMARIDVLVSLGDLVEGVSPIDDWF
jgi:hypothetical protein